MKCVCLKIYRMNAILNNRVILKNYHVDMILELEIKKRPSENGG